MWSGTGGNSGDEVKIRELDSEEVWEDVSMVM